MLKDRGDSGVTETEWIKLMRPHVVTVHGKELYIVDICITVF